MDARTLRTSLCPVSVGPGLLSFGKILPSVAKPKHRQIEAEQSKVKESNYNFDKNEFFQLFFFAETRKLFASRV